jgi:ribosomal protein S14
MKRLITSPDSAELGLLKNLLSQAGIRCVERNQQIAQTIPAAPFDAELWVESDADYQAATELLADWRHPASATRESWVCPRCGEPREGQFTKCWKCGTNRSAKS